MWGVFKIFKEVYWRKLIGFRIRDGYGEKKRENGILFFKFEFLK